MKKHTFIQLSAVFFAFPVIAQTTVKTIVESAKTCLAASGERFRSPKLTEPSRLRNLKL
jgi:hypothetical protein